MSDFRQIGAIALLLFLGACAPVEEPVTVSAPIAPIAPITPIEDEKPAEQADIAPDSAQIAETAIAPSDNQTNTDQTGTDQTNTDQTSADQTGTDQTGTDNAAPITTVTQKSAEQPPSAKEEDLPKEEEATKEVAAPKIEKTPPPPPLPDPFNPQILIGQPSTALAASLGASDYSYDNSGMTISHYRAKACIVLVFSAPDDAIAHIDVRHPILGSQLDEGACYQELGAKKASLN